MSFYTNTEIEELRNRWKEKEGLVNTIINLLKGEGIVANSQEAEKRLRQADEMLSNNGISSLEESVIIWNLVNKKIVAPRLDLRGLWLDDKNIGYIFFAGAFMEGSSFGRSILQYANFNCAHLENAFFGGTTIMKCDFIKAHLEWADFGSARLKESNLYEAHLEGAFFVGANLENVDLTSACLQGSLFDNANLKNAHLALSNLKGTRFENSSITGANFNHASLGELTYNDFSDNCNLPEKEKQRLLSTNSITNFENVVYMPRWWDHFLERSSFEKASVYHKDRDMQEKYPSSMKYKKPCWEEVWYHIINRWFLTSFLNTKIDKADTTLAQDLYRYVKDQQFLSRFKVRHPIIYWFWKVFSDCGGKLSIVAFWGLVFVLIFAVLYMILPLQAPEFMKSILPNWMFVVEKPVNPTVFNEVNNSLGGFWKWLFVSFDIFSNLGIRSTHPQNPLGVILILSESVLGFMMLGMLISVLSNRFARRS